MHKLTPSDSKALFSALKNVREGDTTTVAPVLPSCKGEQTTLLCVREKEQKYWELEVQFLGIKICNVVVHKSADLAEVEGV